MRFRVYLFVFLAALFALASMPAYAANEVTENLKSLASPKEPVTVQAESVQYDRKTNVYTATGKVIISQGGNTLTADKATLNLSTGDAEAVGKARLVSEDRVVFADRIKMNFNTRLGVIQKGNIFVQKKNYHISGETLESVGEDEYVITDGTLTTCDGDSPDWKISADYFHIRMDQTAEGKNVVIRVKGIPVFYSPYAWFPLIQPRTTGFLTPGIGYSTKQGVRIFEGFYWAPTDNLDSTVTADYRSKRGIGVGAEFRFAFTKDWIGSVYGYYMDDHSEDRQHYKFTLKDQQPLTDTISLRADINLSDPRYYKNLTDTALERTQRSVDSNLFITDRFDWGRAYLFGQYTQHLDFNSEVTVQRLPDLGINVVKKRLADTPFYFDLEGSSAYFTKQTGVTGARFDLFPKLTGEFNIGGINVSPRVGYRETAYSLGRQEKSEFDDERGLFGSGVSVQTGFSRVYKFDSGPLEGIRHTIEPTVAYDYVLGRGGTNFPKFDGLDTIGRRDMVAYSLTNRFVIKYRGGETPRLDYLTVKLSQYYDVFGDTRFLEVERDAQGNVISESVIEDKLALSPVFGEIVYRAASRFTVNNDFRYDVQLGKLRSINTYARLADKEDGWHVGLGQRYSQDGRQTFISPSRFDFFTENTDFPSDFITKPLPENKLNFLTFDGAAKLSARWEVAGHVWYDVHNHNLRESGLTVTYSSQCWGLTTNYIDRPGEKQVLVMVNLKGIGTTKL